MNTPKTIAEYLDQLRAALHGADPSLVQDALYDAEEYLRSALAEQPDRDEADLLAEIASSYGAPLEVADIYRETEVQVTQALRPPSAVPNRSPLGDFFSVAIDPRTYGALFYMLLSLATGLVYFVTVSVGMSLSAGLAVLIIGVPFVIVFVGLVRVLSLVEGRIVEVMLGERMPRRPLYADRAQPVLARIQAMFTDPRTWSTMLYMVLMLPLGVVYFTSVVTGLGVSLGLILGALGQMLFNIGLFDTGVAINGVPDWMMPLLPIAGALVLLLTLHAARAIGRLHGALAKHLLVRA